MKFRESETSQVADHFSQQIYYLLQAYLDLHLMPGEAVSFLHKAECHLGWDISYEEIE